MIKITVLNADGKEIQYKYENAEQLKNEWESDSIDMNVPDNDATVTQLEVDSNIIFDDVVDNTFKRNGTDTVWFEDVLTYFGIEIW